MSSDMENAVMEAPITDRQKWRSMMDMLPLVEVEIQSAQQARADANEAFELAKRKHFDAVAEANQAEQAAAYSKGKIDQARAKLMESAPAAIKLRIKNLETQIREVRFGDEKNISGADLLKHTRFEMDRFEERFSETKDPNHESKYLTLKGKLEQMEAQIATFQKQLDAALAEALMVD